MDVETHKESAKANQKKANRHNENDQLPENRESNKHCAKFEDYTCPSTFDSEHWEYAYLVAFIQNIVSREREREGLFKVI